MARRAKGEGRTAKDGSATFDSFPIPDRFTRSGHRAGDICFECECGILAIGGPDGIVLAWCECLFP